MFPIFIVRFWMLGIVETGTLSAASCIPTTGTSDRKERNLSVPRQVSTLPDGKIEIKNVFVAGTTAVCEFVARGTHKGDLKGVAPTGKRVEINVCNVMEVRDGKSYREREYMDMLTMMVQVGAVKPPGATSSAA